MIRTRAGMAAAATALALSACAGSSGGGGAAPFDPRNGGPPPRDVVIEDLALYPSTASVGEGAGSAYLLGAFGLASPGSADPPSLRGVVALDGVDVTADFVEVDGTTFYFGLYVPTRSAATHTVGVRLDSGASPVSNALSVPFAVTQDLDPAFGTSGLVVRDDVLGPGGVDEVGHAVALQPDGKIVVGGVRQGGLVERYLADGTPDASFAQGGRFVFTNDWTSQEIRAIAVQPDGKILAAGVGPFRVNDAAQAMVLRLLPDGTLDAAFGTSGVAVTGYHYEAAANAVALQPDGKILLAGRVSTATDTLALVARLGPDGAFDPTFGASGVVEYSDPSGGWDELFAVIPDAGGRVVVAGSSSSGDAVALTKTLVMRLGPDGAPDPTFGTTGVVRGAFFHDSARGVGVQPSGRILVGGGSWDEASANDCGWVIGLTSTGALDPAYGEDGSFWTGPFAPYGMYGTAFAMAPSGASALVGYRGADAVAFRLTADGLPDPGFSRDGFAAVSSGGVTHGAAVAIAPDDTLLLVGQSAFHDSSGDAAVLLARFLAPGPP